MSRTDGDAISIQGIPVQDAQPDNGDILQYNSSTMEYTLVAVGAGSGDMLKSVYDPTNVSADAFSMDNMVEGVTTKILTGTERSNISLNTTHRGLTTGNPHNVLATQITDFDTEVANNTAVTANTAKRSYPVGDESKLAGIETGADVTDTANVTASGALMDSEVTNLSQVKAFDTTDYATAAQGSLADSALQSGDIGVTVQAYDADTTKNDVSNTFTAAQTFTTTRNTAGLEVNAQTGTAYTLVLGDAGKLITLTNAGAITLTVPTNANVAFEVGAVILLEQLGAGQVTVGVQSGVTVNSKDSNLKITGQYSGAYLRKTSTNLWVLIGDLSA